MPLILAMASPTPGRSPRRGSKPIRMDVPGIVNRWSSSSARNLTNKSRFDCFGSGPCTRHGATTTHLSSALDSGIYPIEIEFPIWPFFRRNSSPAARVVLSYRIFLRRLRIYTAGVLPVPSNSPPFTVKKTRTLRAPSTLENSMIAQWVRSESRVSTRLAAKVMPSRRDLVHCVIPSS